MNKTKWQRTQVIVAGVVMNLLLAWVLLTIGFMVGMQPLMVSSDDFLNSIRDGRVEVAHGVVIDSVQPDSWAEENGFLAGDVIVDWNGESVINLSDFYESMADEDGVVLNSIPFVPTEEDPMLGLIFNSFELPRVVIDSVGNGLPFQPGDTIVSVNGEGVFYAEEFQELLLNSTSNVLTIGLVRDEVFSMVQLVLPNASRSIISEVLSDSPAEAAGLLSGDHVVAVNGEPVWTPQQIVDIVVASESDEVTYEIERANVSYTFVMTKNEEGFVGVLLAELYSLENLDFSYYNGVEVASVTEVHDVKYPWYQAPIESFVEIKRVSAYTAVMIGQVFGDIVTTGDVPDSVAGPVGIAQMTGLYVQEGLIALMRFTALLSLSLAVINIFPFPALDGGRFLFIVIEAIRGKPVDSNLEGKIHSVGFIILLLIIFLVTFQDIQRLFA